MEKEKQKKKERKIVQKRRTKKELNKIIWEALERIIIKSGFNSVTLVDLAREAGVEPPVIYSRFEDVNDLFNQYAFSKDLWLISDMRIDPAMNMKENTIRLYCALIDNLYADEIMQRILLWELNDTHRITRRIAMNREFENSYLLAYFNQGTKKYGISLNMINAMIISSIYYLILHKNVSTFCTVDFKLEEGKELLKKTIAVIVNQLFEE